MRRAISLSSGSAPQPEIHGSTNTSKANQRANQATILAPVSGLHHLKPIGTTIRERFSHDDALASEVCVHVVPDPSTAGAGEQAQAAVTHLVLQELQHRLRVGARLSPPALAVAP